MTQAALPPQVFTCILYAEGKVYTCRIIEMKTTMPTTTPPRRRNAAATRAAILASARRVFAQVGYDGVGVREIAKGAGVTAMLVNRYFGSKEQLFAEVVAETMATPRILTQEILTSPTPGKDLAAALIEQTKTGVIPLDGFLLML